MTKEQERAFNEWEASITDEEVLNSSPLDIWRKAFVAGISASSKAEGLDAERGTGAKAVIGRSTQ